MLPVINIMLEAKCVFRHHLEDFELEFLPWRLINVAEQMECLQTSISVLREQIKHMMNTVAFIRNVSLKAVTLFGQFQKIFN